MHYDTHMINEWHEERCGHLSRSYANSQADAATIRLFAANLVAGIGGLLIKGGHLLDSGMLGRQKQQLEPIRARADNGN